MTTTEEPVVDAPVEHVAKKAKIDTEAGANSNADAEPVHAPETVEVAGWPDHKMNVNLAIDKESEGKLFSVLAASDCIVLQGMGDKAQALMEECGVKTVTQLAEFKYYKMAKVRSYPNFICTYEEQ